LTLKIRLMGTERTMTSNVTKHTARRLRPDEWTVSWLPGRRLDRNQATTAMVLAEAVATNELHCDHRLWPHIDRWAAELGLTGPDAVVRASEPPQSTP
jgi:hypothetical protein